MNLHIRPGSATSTPPVKKMRLVSYGGGEDDDEVDVTKSDAEEGEGIEGEGEAGSGREDATEKEASERDDNSDMDLVCDTNVLIVQQGLE